MSGDDGGSPDCDGTNAASDATGDAAPSEGGDPDRGVSGSANEEPDRNADSDVPTGTDGAASPADTEAPEDAIPGTRTNPTPTAGSAADAASGGEPTDRIRGVAESAWLVVREMLISAVVVAAIGLLLFGVSGVWPPMVAVESGSMEPHMHRGDLVVIGEPGRYVPGAAYEDTGVVPVDRAEEIGYRTFGDYGSVVVYRPDNATVGSPVIHRAHFFVEDGENWYDEANPEYHDANSCTDLRNCPAPNAGFITKGDNNPQYDQVLGISDPVASRWIVGVAHVRVPYLGHVRLWLSGTISPGRAAGTVAADGVSVRTSVTEPATSATGTNATA